METEESYYSLTQLNNSFKMGRVCYINKIKLIFVPTNPTANDASDLFMKYLKNIKIYNNDNKLYEANGFVLTMINNLYNKNNFNHGHLYIDLNFPIKIPPHIPIHLSTEINEEFKNAGKLYYIVTYGFENENKYLKSSIIENFTYNCQRIQIDSDCFNYKQKLCCNNYVKFFLVYVSDGIKITDITIIFNKISQKYSYNELNGLFPNIHFNIKNFPKNLMLIPFINNSYSGLNTSSIDSVELEFEFSKNKGGYIYVISEIVDFINDKTWLPLHVKNSFVDEYYYAEELQNQINENIILEITI